ncbi:MAG: tRNA pseudouridine(13) synthase TruD [Planctomycetales bacterium]|nr:tRNA pseudouridine(13) synthase TruD [Planctomycetales bacterium]
MPLLPTLTPDLPGIRGVIKQQLEDFEVDEIPAYEPSGKGDFLYLWVEKIDLSAEQLTSHLAKFLKIAHQDIGMAGMKDRQAITRQFVSVPARCEPLLESIQHAGIRVLSVARHRNKLRTGHLKGNRFSILVRNCVPGAETNAAAIADRIRQTGFANYFGDQRFGRDGETLQLGCELLRGTKTPGDIARVRRKFLLRLALSAVQSHLFNLVLAERITDGLIDQVLAGDVMQVVESGGPFVVEDVSREQPRFDAREIVTTGPLFGPKMKQPLGDVTARESRVLEQFQLEPVAFTRYANLTSGTRRPFLIWPENLQVESERDGIRLRFTLPAGCYATVLLNEFQKS